MKIENIIKEIPSQEEVYKKQFGNLMRKVTVGELPSDPEDLSKELKKSYCLDDTEIGMVCEGVRNTNKLFLNDCRQTRRDFVKYRMSKLNQISELHCPVEGKVNLYLVD